MKKTLACLVCLCVLLTLCALPILATAEEAPPQDTTEEAPPVRQISVPVVAIVIGVGAVLIALIVVLPTAMKAKRNP